MSNPNRLEINEQGYVQGVNNNIEEWIIGLRGDHSASKVHTAPIGRGTCLVGVRFRIVYLFPGSPGKRSANRVDYPCESIEIVLRRITDGEERTRKALATLPSSGGPMDRLPRHKVRPSAEIGYHPSNGSQFVRAVRCQSFVASRDVAGKKQLRELRPRERCDLSDWMTTYHAVGPLLSKGAPSSQVVGLFHSNKPGRFLNRNMKLV